ncbi:MAG TPA: DUF433 domain-containing protein [Flavobacteriales bacterium]|nr:DUF433 domain-containing protein [Flavobacteriales bacterium]
MRQELIEIKPDVANGKPVVKGTRITVQSVLELLAAGDGIDEVLKAYPSITREHVLACVEMAARIMGNRFSALPLA